MGIIIQQIRISTFYFCPHFSKWEFLSPHFQHLKPKFSNTKFSGRGVALLSPYAKTPLFRDENNGRGELIITDPAAGR